MMLPESPIRGNNSLFLGPITSESFKALPDQLDPGIARYLTAPRAEALSDFLTRKENSDYFKLLHQPKGVAAWGIHIGRDEKRCIGEMSLLLRKPSETPSHWTQAGSWITILDPHWAERGIDKAAFPYLVSFGLSTGLDVIRATVHEKNSASLALHEACGFTALRTINASDGASGQMFYDMALYNPALNEDDVLDHLRSTVPGTVTEREVLVRAATERVKVLQDYQSRKTR